MGGRRGNRARGREKMLSAEGKIGGRWGNRAREDEKMVSAEGKICLL